MYQYFKGELKEVGLNYCVVEVGGVGYRLEMGVAALARLAEKTGQQVKIFTLAKIREEDLFLYGFISEEELLLFRQLISVSGIGPKSALSILSLGAAEDLSAAIEKADVDYISRANGVGKKTAQRLIVELKGKLVEGTGGSAVDRELEQALRSLGYNKAEYQELLKKMPAKLKTIEEKLGWMLKSINN
jgi:holliday junction DNA helicase RuvA